MKWPKKLKSDFAEKLEAFFQLCANRIVQGEARYGQVGPGKDYFVRIEREIRAYKITGNRENLINAANYCSLEFYYPNLPFTYFDNRAKSATRGKIGV